MMTHLGRCPVMMRLNNLEGPLNQLIDLICGQNLMPKLIKKMKNSGRYLVKMMHLRMAKKIDEY